MQITVRYDGHIKYKNNSCRSIGIQALISAMNGTTRCFYSNNNDIFTNMNVFDAAYSTACETVMFSQEAIDASTLKESRCNKGGRR